MKINKKHIRRALANLEEIRREQVAKLAAEEAQTAKENDEKAADAAKVRQKKAQDIV